MTTHTQPRICPHIPRRIDIERCPETRTREFAAYADGQFLGYTRSYLAAETLINETIYDWIDAGLIPTEAERAADAEEVHDVRTGAEAA